MFGLLGIAAIISTCVEGIKDAFTPTLTSDDWANKDLIHRDIMNGNSANLSKNAHRGRYRLAMKYREPHRDPKDNKIIIENEVLYWEDVRQYGAYEAKKMLDQGKYNLTESEMKIRRLELEKKYIDTRKYPTQEAVDARKKEIDRIIAASNFDYKKAEAVLYWQKAHDANNVY